MVLETMRSAGVCGLSPPAASPGAAGETVFRCRIGSRVLRVNDYFVLSDLEMHLWEASGYRAITDVDIVAVRHVHPLARFTTGMSPGLWGVASW